MGYGCVVPAIVSPVRAGAVPVRPVSQIRYLVVGRRFVTFNQVRKALIWPTDS